MPWSTKIGKTVGLGKASVGELSLFSDEGASGDGEAASTKKCGRLKKP
jgi:hypothetical protein